MIHTPDGETLLTRDEFKTEFNYDKEVAVDRALADGLPKLMVNGAVMFPKNKCHEWHGGTWKKNQYSALLRARKEARHNGR